MLLKIFFIIIIILEIFLLEW